MNFLYLFVFIPSKKKKVQSSRFKVSSEGAEGLGIGFSGNFKDLNDLKDFKVLKALITDHRILTTLASYGKFNYFWMIKSTLK